MYASFDFATVWTFVSLRTIEVTCEYVSIVIDICFALVNKLEAHYLL